MFKAAKYLVFDDFSSGLSVSVPNHTDARPQPPTLGAEERAPGGLRVTVRITQGTRVSHKTTHPQRLFPGWGNNPNVRLRRDLLVKILEFIVPEMEVGVGTTL